MEADLNRITVVFSGIKDPKVTDEIIANATPYPPEVRKVQNNGIVAYVVRGILPEVADAMFRDKLSEKNLFDAKVTSTLGNAFEI